MHVCDKDRWGPHDNIGELRFPVRDLIRDCRMPARAWHEVRNTKGMKKGAKASSPR